MKPSISAKALLEAMSKCTHGRIRLRLPDGVWREFGGGELLCEGKVKTWAVLDAILSRGDIGFAEAYISGDFDLDRPEGLVAWACANEAQLKSAIYGSIFTLIFDRLLHWKNRNTIAQAKQNIASHYDLGNDFYRLWLDSTLTYSSALFTPETPTLESAQIAKYERILDQLAITQGQHILEIGCGWGGFFSHAVRSRNVRVTAVTISERQYETCLDRVEREGLKDNVSVLLTDYRNLQGQFDHIVSIEMIEAVGRAYWPAYFGKIRSSLKPGGRAVIQGITLREDLFSRYKQGTDFIQQYVFPGGELPTQSLFSKLGNQLGLELVNLHAFPDSYRKTLNVWRERFTKTSDQVRQLGFNEEFLRLWTFYLAYCEGAFETRRVGVAQFTLT